MASKIRLNFHSDSEAMINKQINLELFASYTYMAMVSWAFSILPGVPTSFRQEFIKQSLNVTKSEKTRESLFTF